MYRLISTIAISLLLLTAASAQQTPTQLALQIDGIINQWAQAIESQQQQIAALQKQIADMKAKYEPKNDAPAKK